MNTDKVLIVSLLFCLLLYSCKSTPVNLAEQLKTNYALHLKKMDSTVVLDSFKIIRIDSINDRMRRQIDDTIYTMEFNRVQAQLANAIREKKKDSVEFYQGEVDYMITQVDSLGREVSKADTVKKAGLLVICKIQLSKNSKTAEGLTYYFLDFNNKIWNSEMIDSTVSVISRELN
jgi:hypothetical protein